MGPVLPLGQKTESDNPCSKDASDINIRREILCVHVDNGRGEDGKQR